MLAVARPQTSGGDISMQTSTKSLPELLRELRAAAPGAPVLSIFLDTSPERVAGRAYLLTFRDLCQDVREHAGAGERDQLEAAIARAERYVVETATTGGAGMAVFATASPDRFHAVPLPARPPELAVWAQYAETAPLEAMVDDLERVAIALFDGGRARLFTLYLGEIEERRELADDLPSKQATGGWYGLAQTRFARHREDHLLRHVKRTTAALLELLRARPFDRLFLAGPPEALSALRHHLPRPLRARLVGTLSLERFASETEIRKAGLAAAERAERRAEIALVAELIDAATSVHVALGADDALEALNEGRVHALVIADSFADAGWKCPTCGRLRTAAVRCPECGIEMTPARDLRREALARALGQGARLELVSGEAAAMLAERGGIGAWTRF
jgi:peptide subunit release factor 1 (eRF1)